MHSQRSGPEPLPDDSWASAGTGLQRHIRRSPRRYRWVVLILAVTALVPAVLVPLLSSDDQPDRRPDPTLGAGSSSSPTGASATPTAVGVAVTAPSTPPATSAGALVIEAEAPGVQRRQADAVTVEGASGGRAVRFTDRNGEVEFPSLALPATDRYRVTIVYAAGGSWWGNVQGSNDSERMRFGSGTDCCHTVSVTVRLSAGGSLSITLSRGRGAFPAIDRVVIERA